MSRLGCAVSLLAFLLVPAAAHAATVAVTGKHPRESITVTIKDAPVDVVLDDLHKRYGFEVSGLQNATRSGALSATMTGSLQNVLERLLRNWNHLIVRSPDNACGIAKVMIINEMYGASARPGRRGQASGDAGNRLRQALSRGDVD
jgi:hypothetical protein